MPLLFLGFVPFSAGLVGVSKAFPAFPLVYLGICKGPVLVFVKKIANPFSSIVVLTPKVLTGCLVTLGLCKGSSLSSFPLGLQEFQRLFQHFLWSI